LGKLGDPVTQLFPTLPRVGTPPSLCLASLGLGLAEGLEGREGGREGGRSIPSPYLRMRKSSLLCSGILAQCSLFGTIAGIALHPGCLQSYGAWENSGAMEPSKPDLAVQHCKSDRSQSKAAPERIHTSRSRRGWCSILPWSPVVRVRGLVPVINTKQL
jgi:hypothetical protein